VLSFVSMIDRFELIKRNIFLLGSSHSLKLLLVDYIKSSGSKKAAWCHAPINIKSSHGIFSYQPTWTDHQQIFKGFGWHWQECCCLCQYVYGTNISIALNFCSHRICQHYVSLGHHAAPDFVLCSLPLLPGMPTKHYMTEIKVSLWNTQK